MHFFEYGKSNGVPVLFLLGTPHSGDSVAELAALAAEYGVRLICPTRSWYVDSAIEPSFEICSALVMRHFEETGIAYAYVIGASGGGPFALHFASNYPAMIGACYLLASMGDPGVFRRTVVSPHTRMLVELFSNDDYDGALAQLSQWGISAPLAHGVWADFKVLLGSWSTINLVSPVPVYFHHGEVDDNAPLESVRTLASKLANCQLRISPDASHHALATDKEYTEFRSIFAEIMERCPASI